MIDGSALFFGLLIPIFVLIFIGILFGVFWMIFNFKEKCRDGNEDFDRDVESQQPTELDTW